MASVWRDLRYGLRMLAKVPGHTVAAAIALSLGIGLTTATFSIVYGVVFRGLPFDHSERIMSLGTQNLSHDRRDEAVGVHDYLDWCKRQKSFEGLAALNAGTVTVSGGDHPERLNGATLTVNALTLLRVKPILGRGFQPGDDQPGAAPVALLGYRLWKDHYGGDPRIAGRAVRVNGQPTTVVGVMPAGFLFPFAEQLWTPQILDPAKTQRGKAEPLLVFGRLRPGVSRQRAQAEMDTISKALAAEYPKTNGGWSASVVPYQDRALPAPIRRMFFTMLGAVCCVLLIACINVASLIMARASQRTREIAIRSALGAGRGQVIRQILTESLLLAAAGAAAGVALAWWGVELFNAAVVDKNLPFWMRVALDLPALLFTLGATLSAALITGLVPAFEVSRTQLNDVLKDEGRGATSLRLGWLSRMVVVAELALSCALLVAAGLMVKSIVLAQNTRYGFDTAHLLTARVPLFEASYPKATDRAAFYQRLIERLAERPGVEAVGATTVLPSVPWGSEPFAVDGKAYASASDYPVAHGDVVSAGLFATLGVRPLAGREFERQDSSTSQPVVLVNQSLARKMWPGTDPLGKRLRMVNNNAGNGGWVLGSDAQRQEPWRTVIGIVPDLRLYGLNDKKPDGLFLPLAQVGGIRVSLVLRTPREPLSLVEMVRAEVTALDKDTPIYFVKTMERAVVEDRFFISLFGSVFLIFGLAALVLAAVGIYGVIAFSVARRTQEMGLRMALGARRGTVLAMLVKQAAIQLGIGLALGLPAAFAVSLLLGGILFDVRPGDPAVFLAVVASLSAVAMAACLVPGRRAMEIEPIVALRYD
ncbi:MAG TPA: ABC transporter permease [Thermoanaerobaculia bacterium]|nr:ABC transporter permease [Thermoanaerobaculia bacterium]